jgi:hypothetical protein
MSPWTKLKLKRAAWWNQKDDIERGDFIVRSFFLIALLAICFGAFLILNQMFLVGGLVVFISLSVLLIVFIAS